MPQITFTLRQLSYFDAIASTGSLTAAAKRCNISASALALAINDLEESLGLQLFLRRKGKGATLTRAGRRILANGRSVLSEAEVLMDVAGDTSSRFTSEFAVGCYTTLAPFLVPSVLTHFQTKYPELLLDIQEGTDEDLTESLLQGQLDAAIVYGTDIEPKLTFDPIFEFHPHMLVAKTHPLAARKSVNLAELAEETQILFDAPPSRLNTERIFADKGMKPRIEYTTSSFELVRCLVARGFGYAMLFQQPRISKTYEGKDVAVLQIEDDLPPTSLGLARIVGAPKTARYTELFNVIAAQTGRFNRTALSDASGRR
ncbi:MAG: LysR family transcriptional regulator [Paracoccaceae bacterium]